MNWYLVGSHVIVAIVAFVAGVFVGGKYPVLTKKP